jgi:hypothetical protein
MSYQLASQLIPSHQSDVKAVIELSENRIASASRDQSVVVWKRAGNVGSFRIDRKADYRLMPWRRF